ncbi:MAG: ATP-binding protein [Verrucomicrobiota bacterium]
MVSSARETVLSMIVFVSVLTLLGIFFLIRTLSKPLKPLLQAAHDVSDQQYEQVDLKEEGPRELRQLSLAVNQMARSIQSHHELLEDKVQVRTKELTLRKLELATANSQMNAAFEANPDGIILVGRSGEIFTINLGFRKMFGLAPTPTYTILELERILHIQIDSLEGFHGFMNEVDESISLVDGRRELEWEVSGPNPKALRTYTNKVIGEHDEYLGRLWVVRDVSQTRDLEKGLQQAQKMEAIGRMAGSIAHDFNNVLTGISGNLSLLSPSIPPGTEPSEYLQAATLAAIRAKELVTRMLGAARKSFLNLQTIDANGIIQEVSSLVRAGIDRKIEMQVSPVPGSCLVLVDPSQLHQVIMNLCVNARDAMMESGGGNLFLRTQIVDLTKEDTIRINSLLARQGRFVTVEVEDTGTGIPPEVLERMFEPFFTTKGEGKGTGLGLATTVGIIEQHQGWMTCETEVGKGTTFRVYLPHQEPEEQEAAQEKVVPMINLHGEEPILIVDDEPMVRNINKRYLTSQGYEVLTAVDGEDALRVFEEEGKRIRLVLLDLTMPKLSGPETFQELRRRDPALAIIIYSGFILDEQEFASENGSRADALLTKPLDLEQLGLEIRTILNQRLEAKKSDSRVA